MWWKILGASGTVALIIALSVVSYKFGFSKGDARATETINAFKDAASAQEVSLIAKNTELQKKYDDLSKEKQKTITETETVYKDRIQTVYRDVPSKYSTNSFVEIHDAFVLHRPLNENLLNLSDSKYSEEDSVQTIIHNYTNCEINAARLQALQDYIREVNDAKND